MAPTSAPPDIMDAADPFDLSLSDFLHIGLAVCFTYGFQYLFTDIYSMVGILAFISLVVALTRGGVNKQSFKEAVNIARIACVQSLPWELFKWMHEAPLKGWRWKVVKWMFLAVWDQDILPAGYTEVQEVLTKQYPLTYPFYLRFICLSTLAITYILVPPDFAWSYAECFDLVAIAVITASNMRQSYLSYYNKAYLQYLVKAGTTTKEDAWRWGHESEEPRMCDEEDRLALDMLVHDMKARSKAKES